MINVTKSYLPDIRKYKSYIDRIYETAWLTNNGQFAQELAKKLEDYLGVKNLLLVTNATIGLQIAYKALNLTGEVITSPFSFVATTSSLVWENLIPTFADIDPRTFCIDSELITSKINSKTSAILPVHVYGNICNIEKIQEIANRYHLKVIYDAAHAFGVNYKQQSVLNYGDISILSFHATKLFHAVEGGALIIKDENVFKKAKEMVNFGFDNLGSGEIQRLGINAKMSEFHAAMGLCILEDMPQILEDRQQVDLLYRKHLPIHLQKLVINENANPNYAYFPIVLKTEKELLQVISALKQNDIFSRRYFYPSLNTLPYIQSSPMPISEDISKRVLCLPIYPSLKNAEVTKICNIITRQINSGI